MPSMHEAGTQILLELQMFEVQSESARQPWLLAHVGQRPPPQSMSVSLVPGFFTPSKHEAAHVLPSQDNPLQSFISLQVRPGPQPVQVPPQSRSVSVPFFTPSVHEGAVQTLFAPHCLELQSASTLHLSLSLQGGQSGPPQSLSVSVPLASRSVQVAPPTPPVPLALL